MRIFRVLYGVLAALGACMVVVTVTPLVPWWARHLAGPWTDPRGEVLIVLGGSVVGTDQIGISSYWRTVYAGRVYRAGGVERVVISGGSANAGSTPVSVLMRPFLAGLGVPAERIECETSSTSTRENAAAVAHMLAGDGHSKVLLTSDYHMYRAFRAFRKAGLTVLPHPFPDALKRSQTRMNRWQVFLELSAETGKIVYYRLRGWI
jgi:uncharacterized SAM-binding protein YcdF (DUF218 family)